MVATCPPPPSTITRHRHLGLLPWLLLALSCESAPPTLPQDSSAVTVSGLAAGARLEIRPELELLSGVLSQTVWMSTGGPQGDGNEYFRALKSQFDPFQDEAAVGDAAALLASGFDYDAPPKLLLNLGPLPPLAAHHGYPQDLIERAAGKANLERFRRDLSSLAQKSDFLGWFAAWRPYLQDLLERSTAGFDPEPVIRWLHAYFAPSDAQYALAFAPAMFPSGGYGASAIDPDGTPVVWEVVLASATSTQAPEFPSALSLEVLSMHEWGHSFVNPAFESQVALVLPLAPLYEPRREILARHGYANFGIFLVEQVLRAAVDRGILAKYQSDLGNVKRDEDAGFYLTEFTMQQLGEYEQNREQYPTFSAYLPVLLTTYRDRMDELLALAR
jgi:hypothetical protein